MSLEDVNWPRFISNGGI